MRIDENLKSVFARLTSEIGQEIGRLGVQGSAELASALFNGSAYVPYGQGQNRANAQHNMEGLHENEKERQRENEGRSM